MLYFDTSFLAPLILEESTSSKIETFFAQQQFGQLCISHWMRAGDALHLAIAHNNDIKTTYTLDMELLNAGKLLGLWVSDGLSP